MLATSCSKSEDTAVTSPIIPANNVVYKISIDTISSLSSCNTNITSYLVTTEYLVDNNVIKTFNALSNFTLNNKQQLLLIRGF